MKNGQFTVTFDLVGVFCVSFAWLNSSLGHLITLNQPPTLLLQREVKKLPEPEYCITSCSLKYTFKGEDGITSAKKKVERDCFIPDTDLLRGVISK